MIDELAFLDATAQADLVRRGEATPAELVDAAIARIEAVDSDLNAVVIPLFDKAREQARSDAIPDGPFRGVPLLVKDLSCCTAGDPFYEGMRFLYEAHWVESEDQYVARRLRGAGTVICGRTNTSELGLLPTAEPELFGPTHNPWAPDRSPGGSSGGSAAAVAAGLVPVAHGSDAGGSIRWPASACGLVGLKPSRGRVSLGRHYGDIMSGLVNEHVLTRSVRDSAAFLDVLAGNEIGDPYTAPPPRRPFAQEVGADPGALRVGLFAGVPGDLVPLDPDVRTTIETAARHLEALGHTVETDAPKVLDTAEWWGDFVPIYAGGFAWSLARWERMTGATIAANHVEPSTWAMVELGRLTNAAQYLAAIEKAHLFARDVAEWHAGGFDLLLLPTCATLPPLLGEWGPGAGARNPMEPLLRAQASTLLNAPFNITGQPAISVPLHQTADGIPVGVQLVAPYGREELLLQVASQLEQAHPWAHHRPAPRG